MAFKVFKALAFYFDSYFSGLATTVAIKGNTVPLKNVTTVPAGAPPGGAGVQFFVDPATHAVTIYVWDGSVWQAK